MKAKLRPGLWVGALLGLLLLGQPGGAQSLVARHTFTRSAHVMGSRFTFTVVAENDSAGQRALRAGLGEVKRIDHLMSFWDSTSEVVHINRMAGIQPVAVSAETFDLINRTLRLSQLSGGAFDISFASADKLYKFDRQAHSSLPDSAQVRASVRRIGWQKIKLNAAQHTVYLPEKGMRINLAGILQGYGIRRAKQVLTQLGIRGGLLNGSGDIYCWGRQADGSLWRVAIGDPDHPHSVAAWVDVTDVAVVTAGNYEQYFTVGGQVYGHIINPHTGYPSVGLRSVTIVCADVELADGLDEVVFVKGPTDGLAFINSLKGVDCTLITDDNRTLVSHGMKLNYYHGTSSAKP
ncbi:FAD:protein FMN transferase [Hymenobacter sp. BT683]|uniref:FAD:protein FMN transferase n=1 Tax=Hymenobacter jeongseonensis TaxID=2791027 RepID=A0ABS0IJ34_9BACT|nr:FAD:protein FMN transferase [Hymenobacter jeongseonensis]MBF9238348.1 FAD:protein FMN transferase [Hymenobacter jeongseonensis]